VLSVAQLDQAFLTRWQRKKNANTPYLLRRVLRVANERAKSKTKTSSEMVSQTSSVCAKRSLQKQQPNTKTNLVTA